MAARQFLNLEGPGPDPGELGPFDKVRLVGGVLFLNDSAESCAHVLGSGLWYITDGEALGNAELTGTYHNILWGQAKLV